MPVPARKLSALVKQQKKSGKPPVRHDDEDEDDDGPKTDMSKMHADGDDDEKSSTPVDEHEETPAEKYGKPHAESHDSDDSDEDDDDGDSEHAGDSGDEDSDDDGDEDDDSDEGSGEGDASKVVALLSDYGDILGGMVHADQLPATADGELQDDQRNEIRSEMGKIESAAPSLGKGLKKWLGGGNVSWEEAHDVASKVEGIENPEQFGVWLYWAGQVH